MPITRKTYNRKKSEACDSLNGKENVKTKSNTRQSRCKILKKIEENISDSSPNFTVKDKKEADAFDMLRSSPLKQEVNFKPLSFWSKKVKELECKENVKKKKFQLYELSETDDSSSVDGKRTKKKGRTTGRRQKNTNKKSNRVPYQFDAKCLMRKKKENNKPNENREGSIIRERIILQRLNDNFPENKEKFSFNKVTAFGLTSTPGKREKLNLVGGSTFNFLSPITSCGNIEKLNSSRLDVETNCKEAQVKKDSVTIENYSKNNNFITPKKTRKKGSNENITKDLKRVSDSELSRNITLVNGKSEMDSFPEGFSLNNCSTTTGESMFQSSYVNAQESIIDLYQLMQEENEMNVTFLNISEGGIHFTEDCNSGFKLSEGAYSVVDYNKNCSFDVSTKETDLLQSWMRLKVLLKFICGKLNYIYSTVFFDLVPQSNFAACNFSMPTVPLRSLSRSAIEDESNATTIASFNEQPSDLGLHINNSVENMTKISSASSVDSVIRNSFFHVQVRRPCNFFLNFRRSAKEEDFNLNNNENVEICVKQNDTMDDNVNVDGQRDNSDGIRYCVYDSSENVFNEIESFPENDNNFLTNNLLHEKGASMVLSSRVGIEDQQTQMDNTIASNFKNCDMRSNQYRSIKTQADIREENTTLCFTLGNHSSTISLSPERGGEAEIDCSICKGNIVAKEKDDKCSQSEHPVQAESSRASESDRSEREINNCTCFRVIGGGKQYEKQTGTKIIKENESKLNYQKSVDSPVAKYAPCEKTITGDLTFNDESDFPLPIFESTTYKTPVKKTEESPPDKNRTEFVREVIDSERTADLSEITLQLKPGKKWAKSAIILRKALNGTLIRSEASSPKKRGRRYHTFVEEVLNMQKDDQNMIASCLSVYSGAALMDRTSNFTITSRNLGNRTVKVLEETGKECTFQSIFRNNSTTENLCSMTNEDYSDGIASEDNRYFSARDLVLMRCNQEAPLPFDEYFNEKTLKNCKKIGEGTFGEVFMCSKKRVIKVIPIEGPDEVNGEPQKKFEEIITEMVIAMELSNLRHTENYRTSGFSELKRCWCVIGKYPQYLIDLWNDFDCAGHGSENDSPEMFQSDQLYIILEFGNGGQDLESFVFNSAEQSLSIFIQVAFSLAVAEKVLEFEHRDMHWGNILIAPVREKYFRVMIDGKEYKIPTKGVKVTIIDFTLSRISYDGCSIYNDLAVDPSLFISEGDYQFEIYRMMKEEVTNDWSVFKPRTNLFWLHYVLDKMLKMVRYKKTDGKIHKTGLSKFSELMSCVLDYPSSKEFILNNDLL